MKILIALDQSAEARHAAEVARQLFTTEDVHFLVVNVAKMPVPWIGASGFGAVIDFPPEHPESGSQQAAEEAERAASVVGLDDPEIDVRLGDAVVEIWGAAEDHDADIVVVGSHDKGVLERLIDPSVADGIVHRTHRPVLVVSGQMSPAMRMDA